MISNGSKRPTNPMDLGAKCHSCPLRAKKPVFGQPSHKPTRFIVVGEAPGYAEENRGLPFVGRSGKLLDRVLRETQLSRIEAHVTNAMLCNPDTDRPDIKLAATSCCAPRLARELQGVNQIGRIRHELPILTLGKWSALALLGVRTIQKSHGFVWTAPEISDDKIKQLRKKVSRAPLRKHRHALYLAEARVTFTGRTVIPTVHPAFILRGADGWWPILKIDVRRFARIVRGELDPRKLEDTAPYRLASTPASVRRLVGSLRGISGVPGNALSVDIETRPGKDRPKNSQPDPMRDVCLCVGVSNGIDTVEIHPWTHDLAPALRDALRGRCVVTHNGPQFDQIILKRDGAF